jgi:chemotaxis protein CheD
MVGMAEVKVSRSPQAILMALGLGSCIGICAFDPTTGVAGLAHIVLPESGGHEGSPGKFADTGVPLLLQEMRQLGAMPTRLRVALVGGAQLFAGISTAPRMDIGPRNAEAVQMALSRHNITVQAIDVGGNIGRTVYLHADGRVHVKTIGRGEEQLTCLGSRESAKASDSIHKSTSAAGASSVQSKVALPITAGFNPAFLRRASS